MTFDELIAPIRDWFQSVSATGWQASAIFVSITLVVFAVAWLVLRLRQDPYKARLAEESREIVRGREPSPWAKSMAANMPATPRDNGELDRELRRAGLYRPSARIEFLAIRNALIVLAVIVTGLIVVAIGPDDMDTVLKVLFIGLMAAGVAWALPRLILRGRGNKRVDRIERGLPDALDMMSMCMSGGITLQHSLVRVSREIFPAHPDLAVELLVVHQQAELTSLEQSFRQLAKRLDSRDVNALCSLVIQGLELGTSMVDAIREYADDVRLRRRQDADERAAKASVKLLFPIILLLLPSVFIILWGPAILEMIDFFRTFEVPGTTP